MKKFLCVALVAAGFLSVLSVPADAGIKDPAAPGYFVVDVVGERFVLHVTDPDTAETARRILAGELPQMIPVGDLMWGDGGFNFDNGSCYAWHMDPADVRFAEFAVEVCDGRPRSDVQADPTYWVDHLGYFCPWTAELIEEIEKPKRPICIAGN